MLALLTAAVLSAAPASTVTLDVQNAELQGVIRLLAEKARLNVVMGDDVKGAVTLRLRNVSVEDALAIVLRLRALGSEREGNVLRVAPLQTLQAEAQARVRLEQAQKAAGGERTLVFIPVSHARAADLAPHVKATLSDQGTVSVDERTNTLIVQDVK
jgi:type II secretory pathway component HofQ